MSHQELLAKIETRIADFCDDEKDFCDVCSPWKALRAVVELHQEYLTADGVAFCVKCCTKEKQLQYPCPTIQAIEKELE